MRVFLTGATGVVGRRLVPLLQNAGHEVTAAVRQGWAAVVAQLRTEPLLFQDLARPAKHRGE